MTEVPQWDLLTATNIAIALLNLAAVSGLVVLTFLYVRVTGRLVTFETQPSVVVFVDADPHRETIIQIVVHNAGRAMAYDVRFDMSDKIPARAWGLADNAEVAPPMTSGPLIDGIPALGPGASRRIDWGQYWGLKKSLGVRQVEVTCRFRDSIGTERTTRGILEVDSFQGVPSVPEPLTRIARTLEGIQEIISDRPGPRESSG